MFRDYEQPCLLSASDSSSLFHSSARLFDNIITNSTHPLHILLPPKVEKHYSTRPRGHCYQLLRKTSVLDENNIFYRVLYRNILSFKSTDWPFYLYFCCYNSGLSVSIKVLLLLLRVTGQLTDRSRGSWVMKCNPLSALPGSVCPLSFPGFPLSSFYTVH